MSKQWLETLKAYCYEVDLTLFEARSKYPGWFVDRIEGTRDATMSFEDRFRSLAAQHLEAWYEVVFWKMFSQGRRDKTTREAISKIEASSLGARDLYNHCCEYVRKPTKDSLQSFVELLWGKGHRTVAVACVFPAFVEPDRFPLVDTRVAKWAIACLRHQNAADPQGPQLVPPAYPNNGSTVLTLSDWPFIESWVYWCRNTANKLRSQTGFDWRPRDVEMAVFRAWGDRGERRKSNSDDRPCIELPALGPL